jgi:carboxyl-terminal processing protease
MRRYDRAGVFLVRRGRTLAVFAVTPTGPAERAGVRAGDQIVAIDGKPVAERALAEWRQYLRDGAVGKRVALTLQRGGRAPSRSRSRSRSCSRDVAAARGRPEACSPRRARPAGSPCC